jgi:uncharacterized DUF497 family protein
MEFEYDLNKSESNKHKHGISFEEAKHLWLVDNIVLPAVTRGENRYMLIAEINGLCFSCIFTVRGTKTRIISCRRSREKERRFYNEKIKE